MTPLLIVMVLVVLIMTAPKHPVAVLRVVDAAGKPVAGATIRPEGLRTKPGPYQSGWYTWMPEQNGVTNAPVITAEDGRALVPYPKYVFERLETGTLCLSVNHPDYVPDGPECIVANALPAGAPWKARLLDLWDRIRHKALLTRPDPITLQKGAVLKVSVTADAPVPSEAHLFVQVSGSARDDDDFWLRPEPAVVMTRRLAAGPHAVRAVLVDSNGPAWFSDVIPITAAVGQTNELHPVLKPGVSVHGQFDGTVPRPVRQGRVIAHVWPAECKPSETPPQWHAWTAVEADGSFVLNSFPEGELEIVALCDGFISTNGPGQTGMRYPQKHVLGTNNLSITIGMEPTARLEVMVRDDTGQPLKDVSVTTWPNVRYGEWAATIVGSDCYNTADWLLSEPDINSLWRQRVPDFNGVTDASGLAILPSVPPNVTELAVGHAEFALPVITRSDGRKDRQASVTLIAGHTNRVSLQLERQKASTISHY